MWYRRIHASQIKPRIAGARLERQGKAENDAMVSWSPRLRRGPKSERVTLRSLFVDGVVGITPNLVRTRQQKGEDSEGLASVYLRKQK